MMPKKPKVGDKYSRDDDWVKIIAIRETKHHGPGRPYQIRCR